MAVYHVIQIMGHMDVIGFISDGFNIYFPIAVVLLCALTLFNVWTRLLNVIGIQQFMVDDEITQELVDEGKELVRRGLCNYSMSMVGPGLISSLEAQAAKWAQTPYPVKPGITPLPCLLSFSFQQPSHYGSCAALW